MSVLIYTLTGVIINIIIHYSHTVIIMKCSTVLEWQFWDMTLKAVYCRPLFWRPAPPDLMPLNTSSSPTYSTYTTDNISVLSADHWCTRHRNLCKYSTTLCLSDTTHSQQFSRFTLVRQRSPKRFQGSFQRLLQWYIFTTQMLFLMPK